jgi:serine/threonine-protein kinase
MERLPALHHAKLVVLPAGVSVEIDGKPAAVDGEKVEIFGALGSRHQVRLRKGRQERTIEVIITDTGASPEKLELETAKPRAAGPQAATATAQPSPPKPPATEDSLVPDKFK